MTKVFIKFNVQKALAHGIKQVNVRVKGFSLGRTVRRPNLSGYVIVQFYREHCKACQKVASKSVQLLTVHQYHGEVAGHVKLEEYNSYVNFIVYLKWNNTLLIYE